MKDKVLFVCIHNSARSQMAEELLRKIAGDRFDVESAGLEPGTLNPYVMQVLEEDEGIDISSKKTQAVADLLNDGKTYDYVIAVCDGASAERCPNFPGAKEKLHWSFPDPSAFEGPESEKIEQVREIKEVIREQVEDWVGQVASQQT